jgi:hypothetical protein
VISATERPEVVRHAAEDIRLLWQGSYLTQMFGYSRSPTLAKALESSQRISGDKSRHH